MLDKRFFLRLIFFTLVVGAIFAAVGKGMKFYGSFRADKIAAEVLKPEYESLKTMYTRLGEAAPGSWLAEQFEQGQTFAEFAASEPRRPTPEAPNIYILPLGAFSEQGERVLALSAEYIGLYFCLPVKRLEVVTDEEMNQAGEPRNRVGGFTQYLTTAVLGRIVAPRIPKDAFVVIGLTEHDLYPNSSWNFVFGQAVPVQRIGVWSMYRFGSEFREVLRRTMKTATHEISHLFGLRHCIAYTCNVNGSMHLEEADAQPLESCPSCLQKLTSVLSCDLKSRVSGLAEFVKRNGLEQDAAWFAEEQQVLEGNPAGG